MGGVGLGNYQVGGCGWEISRGNEVVDGMGDGLVIRGGVMIEGTVGDGVRKLVSGHSDVEVSSPYQHHTPLSAGLMVRLGLQRRGRRTARSDGERL
eukprot:g38574.t1